MGLEGMSCEERLRMHALPSLEKRRPRDALAALWGGKAGEVLVSRVGITNLCQEGFKLDIRKHLFTMMVVKHWNRFPTEVVDTSCLSLLKRYLDLYALFICFSLLLAQKLSGSWAGWSLKVPSNKALVF